MAFNPLFAAYLITFAVAGVACFASIPRARLIEDPDTRRGIVWLLLLSGGWAFAHVGFLLVPTVQLKTIWYVVGLIFGLAAVGPWLYFCSAYTGRSLHRNRLIRQTAVMTFVAIILVKITNPWHQLYFTTELLATPFPHLAVQNGLFHWLVMGLSYALAFVGYFMLLELFMQVSYDTKPFFALVSVTGLPVVLDVIGVASPFLLDITYEPLGVAIFAVGVFFVYIDRFQTIQFAAESTDPVIVLNEEDRIRDFNYTAGHLFPELTRNQAIGEPIWTIVPAVAEALDKQGNIIELEHNATIRYYRLTENPFGADQAQLGRLITLGDVTEREQYRLELERQNERLDQFASMVSHDLRNPLRVAEGNLELALEDPDRALIESAMDALGRMDDLIEDVLALARQGQPIDEIEEVRLANVVERCWEMVDSADADFEIEGDLTFLADPDRVQQLIENLFRNAIDHVGREVSIRVGILDSRDGFYVADDGPGIPEEEREQVFESGYSTEEDGTGFGLSIVQEIVEAHGWEIEVTASSTGGARFEISGVELVAD